MYEQDNNLIMSWINDIDKLLQLHERMQDAHGVNTPNKSYVSCGKGRPVFTDHFHRRCRAKQAVYRSGLLPQPCEICGTSKNVDAHHQDYDKPLDVRWLCRSHHMQVHYGAVWRNVK